MKYMNCLMNSRQFQSYAKSQATKSSKQLTTMKTYIKFRTKLKPTLLTLLLLVINLSLLADEKQKHPDNLGDTGFTVESQNNTKLIINYSIGNFTLVDQEIDGENFQSIKLPGYFLPNDAGAPNLPGSGRYIAIPQGAAASMKILSFQLDTLNNVNLAPAFRIPKDTEKGPLDYTKNESIYSTDKFYPEDPFVVSDKDMIRGVDVVMLGITPFQYNPHTKQLIIYQDIKVEINFNGGTNNFGDEKLRSRWWDPILSDMLLNYGSLPKMDYNKSFQLKDETGCEYLIITPNDIEFQVWADSIKDFRNKQGILTKVVALDEIGGSTASAIEAYIDNAYNTWDIAPAACLLLGDYGTDASNRIISPLWENYCVSDNIYGDVDGNDLPDIIMARITARDEAKLEIMVTKFLHYETNPPVNAAYYQHPVTSLGWQTESWFQLCSEIIGGFWREVQGKNPVRINEIFSGTPGTVWSTAENTDALVQYFGPNGLGYIPELPSELGGWTGGNADMINTAIDSGAFMVQHRDHGSEDGWAQPLYTNTDINDLISTNLTFVWSVNSLTGKFNSGNQVFAEKLHRYTHKEENGGCFGINAASEITYAFVSDVYVWGAYDNMWPDFMPDNNSTPEPRGVLPAFASAAGKYFLEQSAWPNNPESKTATYHLFHHHGDAFTTVYSEVPQNLTVSHNSIIYMEETSFEVTADEDALIALSVNGELIGTGTGTGSPVSITIQPQVPPDQVLVTVTLQNYFRYEAYVEVLPATGPYVVYNDIEINDASGNGNGIMETSESILASITVKNVGVENAENIEVTLATTDIYITITDGSENYGNISSGATALVADAFSWDVADNIPDMHVVEFELTITDGTSSWISVFSISGHAPVLASGTILIDDYIGNYNGHLDPGETAILVIPTYNNGSYLASNTIGALSCSNQYVTLNNTSFNFYSIGVGSTEEGIFDVSVSDEAPAGEYVELVYEVTSGGYNFQKTYAIIISPLVEDWETGDMSQFDWETGGDANWEVSSSYVYEGSYCIKSGAIDHEQNTYLSLPFVAYGEDSLSFYCRVSSEIGYDSLTFYIDDVEMAAWSGEVAWERSSYLLTAGSHTLKWKYSKDETYSSGEDFAWLDFIVFPIFDFAASFSADETEICEGDPINFYDGSAGEPISWEWTFEGGTPGTSSMQNPVIEYFNSGVYDVSLTVSDGTDIVTLTKEDYITVSTIPGVPQAPTGSTEVCASETTSTYNTSGVGEASFYEWVLDPPEAGTTNGTSLEIIVNWEIDFMGEASLKVAGVNACGTGDFSDLLNITRYLPEVNLGPFEMVCLNWPPFEISGGLPEGGVYSGPGIENSWFDPATAGIGTHTITYTYIDPNSCENFAEETIVVDPCTGMDENISNSGIMVYPIPGKGTFTLRFKQASGNINLEIFSSLNRSVYKANNVSITNDLIHNLDLNYLPAGIYYLHVSGKSL
ncbi:MAG: C25 family cysteine peptidase, partial [Candidatus Electryonea clarkiae]|nr:C25 family cysteine peptidase [Candidatus Electryonea clarkiae]